MTWESVRDAARTLPVEDRLMLLESLWDEIATEPVLLELSVEFRAELDRRIENAKNSDDRGQPWREVIAELRSQNAASARPSA